MKIKDLNGKEKSILNEYTDREMERYTPAIEPPPERLANFLTEHHHDLEAVRNMLVNDPPPEWSHQTEPQDVSLHVNLPGHIKLHRLLMAEALYESSAGNTDGMRVLLKAMEKLEDALIARPKIVNILLGIAENRMLIAAVRKQQSAGTVEETRWRRKDWFEKLRIAQAYESWTMESPQAVIHMESIESNMDGKENSLDDPWKPASFSHRFWTRIQRPWLQLSFLQMSSATVRDGRLMSMQDRCHPISNQFDLPGITFTEQVWYEPFSLGLHHPSFSWWNPIGKIVYAIAIPNSGTWSRASRLELETELTEKIFKLRDVGTRNNHWPESIPGIENSVCKNEKWIYQINPDGTAALKFSGVPEWGKLKGAQVPLQWTEPPPS